MKSMVRKLIFAMPRTAQKRTIEYRLSPDKVSQYRDSSSLYVLCKNFKQLPEDIQYLILNEFLSDSSYKGSFNEPFEPFLQSSEADAFSLEKFVSILLERLPKVLVPSPEESLLDEIIQAEEHTIHVDDAEATNENRLRF